MALTNIQGIGDAIAKKLIKKFGSAKGVFQASRKDFALLKGPGKSVYDKIQAFSDFKKLEKEFEFMQQNDVSAACYGQEDFPKRLKHCVDAPIVLFWRGNFDFNHHKTVSIVGTRSASAYGKEWTQKFVEQLKPYNPLIVSGLAYGIDIMAHRAAIEHNLPTIGVYAHGLDRIYPSHHRATAKKMLENGGWVTEHPSGTNPDRENFPERNRIIAGLSDAIVVVESKRKGGALITAQIGASYNRDVFAVPGRVGDEVSQGCHLLIKSHQANLIESLRDLEYIMGWEKEDKEPAPKQVELFVDLSPEEERVVECLKDKGKLNIDQLCMELNIQSSQMMTLLFNLELSGLVRALPGKMFESIN